MFSNASTFFKSYWEREQTWYPRNGVEDFWEAWDGSRGTVAVNLGVQDQESGTSLTQESSNNSCEHVVSMVSLKRNQGGDDVFYQILYDDPTKQRSKSAPL